MRHSRIESRSGRTPAIPGALALLLALAAGTAGPAFAQGACGAPGNPCMITAADRHPGHRFAVVAQSGTTLAVGAEEDPDRGIGAGAVYIFEQVGGTWMQDPDKLYAGDAAAGDKFGSSVDLDGDTLVVGAILKNGERGAVYVFERSGGVWSQQQKLDPGDLATGDRYGIDVAIHGDWLVAGAYHADDLGSDAGAAYVWMWDGTTWMMEQKLLPPDLLAGDAFGRRVDIDLDTIVAGAASVDCPAPECDPGQTLESTGAAYFFKRTGGTPPWTQDGDRLVPDDLSDRGGNWGFGLEAVVYGDTAAFGEDSNLGIGGRNTHNVFVFDRTGGGLGPWEQTEKLPPHDLDKGDDFGFAMALEGNTLVVGRRDEQVGSSSKRVGTAHVYTRTNATWIEQIELELPVNEGKDGDRFGHSVAISDCRIAIGALNDDHEETTGNSNYGAVYAYEPVDQDNDTRDVCADCDDSDADTYPGAPELCDGKMNDCTNTDWNGNSEPYCTIPTTPQGDNCGPRQASDCQVPLDEADIDCDGFMTCEGDCDDDEPATYPGADEIHDGKDNQCDGAVDDITGTSGFHDPSDKSVFSWDAQAGASEYQVAVSSDPTFATVDSCTTTTATSVSGLADPAPGVTHFILVRATGPRPTPGSWGLRSSGAERTVNCP